ncbi:hypothetical protein Sste5344_000336 [Sporothrix stenoceras]
MGFFDLEGGSAITGVSRKSSRHHSSSSKHHSSGHRERERERERERSGHERKRSRSRSRSGTRSINISARSFFGLDDGHSSKKHHSSSSHHHSANKSTGSFFSLPNVSTRSIFSSFGRAGHGGSSSSYYRRSPRSNFMQRAYKKLKRLIRDLIYYAKKHPMKVFMLAIMPLITGGALTALLARFGLRMPQSLERMVGVGARAMSGDSVGLVGEAMRMAAVAGTGTSGAKAMATSLERGRNGNMQWERRSVERDYFGGGGGHSSRSDSGSGWGGSLAGITKMFS